MRTLCTLLYLLLTFTAQAQNTSKETYVIKGQAIDSLTNDSEPYATIRVMKKSDMDHPVKMLVTDGNGKFSIDLTGTGDYVITFFTVGKALASKEFTVGSGKKEINLGKIVMKEAVNELAEVSIIAQKPLVKVDIDKIEYNIADDPDSKTNNVLEMLRKVPLVTVDGEDKIEVNGSSSFKVHINGKESTLMSKNPTDVLKSMPASTIKYIEVITNPGAKYDAEGIGGILNIVTTERNALQGYTATFNATVSNTGSAGGGAYVSVQSGKTTLSGNYNYNYHRQPRNYSNSFREDYQSDSLKYLLQNGSNKWRNPFQYGNIEGSYEIDTLNLISLSIGYWGGGGKSDGTSLIQMLNADKEITYQYNRLSKSDVSWGALEGNIDYQHSFKKKGELLTLSYKLNTSPEGNEADMTIIDAINFEPYHQYSTNDATTNEHTFQTDYANPLTDIHTIEAGAKYIIRNSESNSTFFLNDQEVKAREDDYKHLQDILSAYGGYSLKYKKFGFKVGLRLEHTLMKVEYNTEEKPDFKSSFTNYVPSANLSYKVGGSQTVRLAYNMRISRPGIWYLNPYVNMNDPNNVRYGNPDLDAEESHTLSTNFSSFTQKFNINLGLSHRFTNNSIENYTFIAPFEGREGVSQSTYGNIGKSQYTNLSLYANWNATSMTRIYVNGSAGYTDIKTRNGEMSNHGFTYRMFGGAQHSFPLDFRISLNGGYSASNIALQGKYSPYYYYSLSVSKGFLKKKLNLSLSASNFCERYMKRTSYTQGATFYQRMEDKYVSRNFNFSISYRIGELKAVVKKAQRGINNDDVKGGGQGGSGGGGGGGE